MPKAKDRSSLFATITDGLTSMAQEDVLQVSLTKLSASKEQPRKYFSPEALEALATSVREHGVLQPLLVRPHNEGYEIIAGERRFRAAKLAKLETVPVLIREITDHDAVELAIIENLQREDLNPVEETEALIGLYALRTGTAPNQVTGDLQQLYFAVTRGEERADAAVAERFFLEYSGMTWKSFVNHRLPLLKLPEDVLVALRQGKLEYTKAREVAKLKETSIRATLLTELSDKGLSLQELKQRIRALTSSQQRAEPTLLSRVDNLRMLTKRSKALESPSTRKKIEALLSKLETLLTKPS